MPIINRDEVLLLAAPRLRGGQDIWWQQRLE
jgi:hypothetical protein